MINLLNIYNINWKNPTSWTNKGNMAWDAVNNSLKIISYSNTYITTKIPIDTSLKYYLQYDIKFEANAGQISYSGTHSYATIDGAFLPGHPGSYDYFCDLASTFTQGVWYRRTNAAISGRPRTGESGDVQNYDAWHTGTKFATIMFLFNYSGTTTQETHIKNLSFLLDINSPSPLPAYRRS